MQHCIVCQKQFRTRNSLTRHERNHAPRARQICCPACNVVFARKDILNRHIRLSHPATSTGVTKRSRCHTACEPCRRNRTRCDGLHSCSLCVSREWDCAWATESRRVSRAAPAGTTVDGDEGAEDARGQEILGDVLLEAESVGRASPLLSPAVAEMPAPVPAGNVSWPWLHELHYLPTGELGSPHLEITAPGSLGTFDDVSALPDPAIDHASWSTASDITRDRVVVQHTVAVEDSSQSTRASRIQMIADTLVNLATSAAFSQARVISSNPEWLRTTQVLRLLLQHEHAGHNSDSILHHVARLYMAQFNPLWPMVSQWQLEFERFNPILLLTMASIGAMYGTDDSLAFGSSMHERLRRLLAAALFDLEGPDDDIVWLAQARVLTQVHALYFGQRQAFSYAQVSIPPYNSKVTLIVPWSIWAQFWWPLNPVA